MAGLEVVVRPVVLPNIRPAPPRVLAPEDDPEKDIAVISGSGGGPIDLTHSWSYSVSRQRAEEEAVRQFNKERVYQKDEKTGRINFDNYVDVERLKRVRLDSDQGPRKMNYADPPKADNVEVLQSNVTRSAAGGGE